MPSRRQVLTGLAALGTATVPGTASTAARTSPSSPEVDLDAALDAFGSGAVDGRVTPRALSHIGEAASVVADEAPAVADGATDRLPSAPAALRSSDRAVGRLGRSVDASASTNPNPNADLRTSTVDPTIDGIAALTVGVDFTARGPVVRARVTGTAGAPSRAAALGALADAGLPVAALQPFAVADGDDLALYAGVDARDDEQGVVLALLLVVLAAVVGTFLLGLGGSVSGGRSDTGTDSEAPHISFSFEYRSSGELTITHDGGDTVAADQLYLVGDGTKRLWGQSGEVSAGDSVTMNVDADATIRILWRSEDGDGSAVLAEWTGPDA
ncbi:MAG: type IV pilin [Haloglomus sp.]